MAGVIFEGADASGKSTLAREIAKASGRPLYLAGGKPKDNGEMWRMIGEQAKALEEGKLVDRVSSISQQVYRDGLWLDQGLLAAVQDHLRIGSLIVFCRPPDKIMLDPSYHEWKPYDTEEWKVNILKNQATYMQRYDILMAQLPCVIYDWTSEEGHHIKELLMDLDTPGVMQGLQDMARGHK